MTEDSRHASETVALFNATAVAGTQLVDSRLLAGTYHRGTLLVETVAGVTPPCGSILDYGCGAGRISRLLADEGFRVLGADPSEVLIGLAQELVTPGLPLAFNVIAPSDTASLAASSFNTILCSSVIEFIPRPADLLGRLRGLLRPDGTLVLTFANRRSFWRRYAEWRFKADHRHFRSQAHVWSESEAWSVLAEARFLRAGPTRFFESPFDRFSALCRLSKLSTIGTLGILIAAKARDGD